MVDTITIPKELSKRGELVVIPRKEYDKLLRTSKKRVDSKLDRDLEKAMEEVRSGKVIGPFSNAKDLIESIKSKK